MNKHLNEAVASVRRQDTAAHEATASVFTVAFKALPDSTRKLVLRQLLDDEDLRDQIEGALLWAERKHEPRIDFNEYLKAKRKKSR